ncbi:dimethylaniline monooxygenase [Colletotrichum tabaci]|uniref:Dimethylaniline monooxygenase n=1 Tax=Colletotrichum tabaci TaxID=1209068 RepID=A0AAV9TAK5_9PEZI
MPKVFRHACGEIPAELRQDRGIINQNITVRSDVAEKLQTGIFTLRRPSIASFTNRKLTRQGGHEWKPWRLFGEEGKPELAEETLLMTAAGAGELSERIELI